MSRLVILGVTAWIAWAAGNSVAQNLRESFTDDPVLHGRFVQQTASTESSFIFNAGAQNLTAVLDVDASPAYYLSNPFTPLTDAGDASFSVRFRVDAVDDQEHPAVFIGLLTDQHVNDFGDGLTLVISLANGIPVVNADIESFDQSYGGSSVLLALHTDYLAVGRYRAALREFAVEVFAGSGFTNLVGFSTVLLPPGQTLSLNRLGLQNAGARQIDSSVGSLTLTVDDLFTPASTPRQISIADATVTEGDSGTTNAVFTVQLGLASSLPITVDFTTIDGTALAGSDYIAQFGTITFAPGMTSTSITVPIVGDRLHENTETFSMVLSNPVDATLLKGTATGTILDNDPVPLLSITDTAGLEGNTGTTNFEFLVTLSAPSEPVVTVDFATADGTAIKGVDYIPTTGTLTFLPGQMTNRIVVPVIGDLLPEPDKTFVVNLSNPSNAGLLKGQGLGTIFDDDSGGRLNINDVTLVAGHSGITPFVFTVALTRSSSQPVTVDYSVASGTAIVGTDLLAASGTLTFPPGTTSTDLTVSVLGSPFPALDKTFFVNLSNPRNATFAKATGLGTIRNNNPYPTLSIGDVSLAEGDIGTKLAVFPLTLSFAINQPVTVSYSTGDDSAVAGVDYLVQAGTVTFAPGTMTQTLSIAVIGNTLNEPDKRFFVNLSQPTLATIVRRQAIGTIVNDDPLPVLSVADIAVPEGNSGTSNAIFTIKLSSPSGQTVLVSYQTADGSASAGSDYVASFGTVTFPRGSTTQTVAVAVLGNTVFEPDKTFLLKLSNPVHAAIGNGQATCTILNDDSPPQMSINDVAVTEAVGGASALFTVTLSIPSTQAPVTVHFSTVDGTATAGLNYVAASGTLNFTPGVTQATITVPILDDLIHASDKIFFVNLSSPTNAVLGSAQGRGTIHDNDPLPKIFIDDAQVIEGDSGTTNLIFNIRLDHSSGLPVTAAFTTSDGTATADTADYVPASGQVRFDPGMTTNSVIIVVNGDTIPEPDETLFVDLSQLVNAAAGNLHAVGTILDDDTLKLFISDTTVTQGPSGTISNAVFTITLNKPSPQVVTVDYATADGTATANRDYYATNGTVAFLPGATSTTVTVNVIGDSVYEPPQTFFVNLTNAVNAILGRAQGVGTIVDDDQMLLIVPAGMAVVAEDCAPANGVIDPGETVTVSFALANIGTVSSSNVVATLLDGNGITPLSTSHSYGVLSGKSAPVSRTFTLRADGTCGQTLAAILQIQNGGTNFGNVAFSFMLGTNIAGQAVCCNSADIAVTASGDLDQVTANHPVTYSIEVTNSGPKAATDLKMTNVWRAPVTFVSTTPSQGACTNQGQTLVWDLGTLDPGASATLQVVVEPQQAGALIAVFYAKAAENDPFPANNIATVVTEVNPPPGLSVNNVQVKEGDSGTTNAVFTVQLYPSTFRSVTVGCATTDGTALAGQDYTATQGTVTIAPGATSATFSVPVQGNTMIQPDRTFFVTLSNPVNASLATEQTTGTGTIVDDDFPILTIDDVTVIEPASGTTTNAVFTFRMSAPPQKPATVEFRTADGTAHAPGDYGSTSGQFTFVPGMTVINLSVQVLASQLIGSAETFFINLTNAFNVNLDRPQAQGNIVANSPSNAPQIFLSGVSVLEGDAHTTTNAVFKLTLSHPSALTVQVDYTSANGSAIGGSDYVITSGNASFAPGETNAVITVIVNGDDIPELDENFFVKLSNPINATLGVTQAEGIIVNDDYLPKLVAAGTQLILENCQPPNHAIDPLETVTVNFSLVNHGLGPTTNLRATLLATNNVLPLSNPQTYGVLPVNGPAASYPFTFMVNGTCGQTFTAELELRDTGMLIGTVPFDMTLGVLTNGQFACCSSADLGVSVTSTPNPVALGSPLTYLVTITNNGPSVATGLLLTNKLSAPAQWVFSSPGEQNCTNYQGQLVCALGDLPPGESMTMTNIFTPAALGDLFNYVLIGASEYDPAPANNVMVVANQVVPPTGLSIDDLTIPAGSQNHTEQVLVRLFPPRSQTVTVDFNFTDGTATAGRDYIATPGTLTFPPGATSTNFGVVIVANPVGGPDRTFYANLSNPVNAQVARAQGTCTIIDNGLPAISINDVAVNVGTNASALAVLTVTLSSVATNAVTVDYFTTNGTAVAGTHYVAQRGTLTFVPGQQALSIRIPVAGSTVDDNSVEDFYLQLVNPQNASLARDRGDVSITHAAPADLSVSNASVMEGNVGLTNAIFSVVLLHPIQNTVSVDFFTSDGTALSGSDYLSTNGTLLFPPGTVQRQISVPVIGNIIYEPDKTFYVNLTNAFNGIIRNNRGVGTILNDDPLPCASIGDLSVVKGQSGTNNALMPLRLSGPSSFTVSVDVVPPDCPTSPQSGSAPQRIVFLPGQLDQSAAFPIVGNTIHQPNETCVVLLTNALNATICRGQAALTVIDNSPLPGVEITDVSVLEGNSGTTPATFTVTLVGATSQTVTAHFNTSDGTAQAGPDYVANSGTLTFPPGTTSTNITVLVNGDLLVEPDETFFVNLTQPINATLFKAQGIGTILNDDNPPQANCPSIVVLATPGNQTCFQPSTPIVFSATPDQAADQIVRVEFYSGSTLLGVDTSSPFEIVWDGASVGDYCITARAVCSSGVTVRSDPTCIGVTDNGAAVAIVRNGDDLEMNSLRNYLLEMGYCARVFDQADVNYDTLSSFQLVIWDDLGRAGLADTTVQILGQLFDNGIPLYLIGERLASSNAALQLDAQSIWSKLLHLVLPAKSGQPGLINFSTAIQARQPGAILSGRFADVGDFAYTNTVDLASASADATSLAVANGADVFLQYPDIDASDYGQARSVSQSFRVLTGGDDDSVVARKALFQGAVCWLLRCSYCGLTHVTVQNSGVPDSVNVGDQFTYDLTVSNNGECIAAGTIVTNNLPDGLGLVGVAYNQGIGTDYDAQSRTLVWRVGSVVSGYENNAILSVTVRALQPGVFQDSACATANYEQVTDFSCTQFDIHIEGTVPPEPPQLSLLQSAPGLYQLRLTGQQGGTYQIQTSSDLSNWLNLTNAPGPIFYLDLPDVRLPANRALFYRAH